MTLLLSVYRVVIFAMNCTVDSCGARKLWTACSAYNFRPRRLSASRCIIHRMRSGGNYLLRPLSRQSTRLITVLQIRTLLKCQKEKPSTRDGFLFGCFELNDTNSKRLNFTDFSLQIYYNMKNALCKTATDIKRYIQLIVCN